MCNIFKGKFNLKSILCVLLAFCIMTTVMMPITGLLASAGNTNEKMLYIKSSGPKELIQRVSVEPGETYYFTFTLSNTIANFNAVCYSDGVRGSVDADIQQVEENNLGGSTVYTYSYTIPSSYSNNLIFFGMKAVGNTEGYFFNASVYKADDTEKTELMPNPDFSDALNEWSWGWDAWFGYWDDDATLTEWSNDTATLKIVDYDEELLGINTESTGKMLYIKSSGPKELIQRVAVEAGETYYFTFGLSNTISNFNAVCYTDGGRSSYDAGIVQISAESLGGSTVYTYSYTIPENFTGSLLFFGMKAVGDTEGYFFNASVYKADDENKTELMPNPDFSSALSEWSWGWDAWFGYWDDDATLTEWSNDTATLKIVDYDEELLGINTESTGKMLYIKSTGPKELIQRVAVEAGETYYFTFGLSNTISNFNAVCYTDGGRSSYDAGIAQISAESLGGSTVYTYSYTIPENFTGSLLFFGMKAVGDTEGYFFNASVYKADDENKTELMPNPDFSDALNEWSWGWDAWFGYWDDATLTEWSNDTATLKIVDYDEELLGIENIAPENSGKMLHIESSGPKELIQRVPVESGLTYHFTFALSNSITNFTAVCYADGGRGSIDADIQQIEKLVKNGCVIYTYSYTIPSSYSNNLIFFGVKASGNTDGYFFNASVYKADDTEKTELMPNPDFSDALNEWSWGWDAWFGYWDEATLTEWSNDTTTIKIVDLDQSLLEDGESPAPSGEKMLYIKSAAPKALYQRIDVQANATYNFTFSLTTTIKNFDIVCNTDGGRSGIDVDEQEISVEKKNGYNVYTYSITIPETADNGSAMTSKVFLGIQPKGLTEGYFFDACVYKANDLEKTELYTNPDFSSGVLDEWAYGWDAWFAYTELSGLTEWNNDTVTLKIVDYDESLFEDDVAPDVKQMLYFINGANTRQFAALVDVKAGEEYCLEFNMFSTGDVALKVAENGLRATVDVESSLVTVDNGNYTSYKYTFTMPEEVEGDSFFVGPNIYNYAEGYIFDLLLYKADDTKKENMYDNPSWNIGLDGWIWGWSEWFGVNSESGIKDWTYSGNALKLMDFDLSKIDELISLINADDGEWWKPEDVIKENTVEIATLKGVLVDQNKKPLSGAKMLLISDSNKYSTTTNYKGEFVFKDFPAGFYELYIIDGSGNQTSTGFFTNFSHGDIVTVNLVCDSSGVVNDSSNNADNSQTNEEPKKPVGILNGTVYTPQLKTVTDLKVFIRGVGETVTDKNGSFVFNDVPVGDYELYTVLEDGSEYVFRTVSVKENVELSVKLKYDVSSNVAAVENAEFNWIWIIVAAVAISIAAIAGFIIIKKKTAK